MAGRGSRFVQAGYDIPKYQILADGRSLFDWSLISLRHFLSAESHVIFICLAENKSKEFVQFRCKELGLNNFRILEIDSVTDGQATTAFLGRGHFVQNEPLLIYNIDTYVNPDSLKPSSILSGADGWVPCFRAQGDHWSFVKLGNDGWAVDLAEKERISEYASIGLYWFAKSEQFADSYERFYANPKNSTLGERYIAPLYRQLIRDGGKVAITDLVLEDVHALGTPNELTAFIESRKVGIQNV